MATDTAFVGIGHSINRHAERGSHITLGCSHLYNSHGEGLQYRLSQIESPIWVNREPAHVEGRWVSCWRDNPPTVLEAYHRIPSRIVLHKLTPFLRDEREGLRDGLNGIPNIDMVEINIDDAIRYVASVADKLGGLKQDSYPVRRGTVVKLSDYAALLWIHGATEALQGRRPYFQGKRRIPAPGSASSPRGLNRPCGIDGRNTRSFQDELELRRPLFATSRNGRFVQADCTTWQAA